MYPFYTLPKQAEDALRHHREVLERLIDAIPVMITLYEPTTRVLLLNREFERVTGWDTPYPHAFEWEYFPGPGRVAEALKRAAGAR